MTKSRVSRRGERPGVAEFAKFDGFRIGKVGFAKPAFESLPQARNPIAIAQMPARILPHAMEHILV
jgi:hypothetical protein